MSYLSIYEDRKLESLLDAVFDRIMDAFDSNINPRCVIINGGDDWIGDDDAEPYYLLKWVVIRDTLMGVVNRYSTGEILVLPYNQICLMP